MELTNAKGDQTMAVESGPVSCLDVSRFFLAKSHESHLAISNLKLQKLVYYAQGFYLAIKGCPLFIEEIQAWDHGPVVVNLYHEYKKFGGCSISYSGGFNPNIFTSEQLDILYLVFELHGRKGAWELRQQTHTEKPWLNHCVEEIADSSEITHKEMYDYFKNFLVPEEYMTNYIDSANDAINNDGVILPDSVNSADDFVAWIKNVK